MLTDFQNSFTVRLSRKFVTKSYLNTPLHPARVATLPCEISMLNLLVGVEFTTTTTTTTTV